MNSVQGTIDVILRHMTERILRFSLKTDKGDEDIFARFFPNGQQILNKTKWRGKEPRTCCVSRWKSDPFTSVDKQIVYNVEVRYRPPGLVSYTGRTKYVGWTAMVLDAMKDGTLLDGHGQQLKDGDPPVYLPFEVYPDAEFNEIDFGDFLDEVDAPDVKHWTYEELKKFMMEEMQRVGFSSHSIRSTFVAPHRQRPNKKILIVPGEVQQAGTDGFDSEMIIIGRATKHFQHVLYVKMVELMTQFLEGKISILNSSVGEDGIFVKLSDSLVDASGAQQGIGSRFDVLDELLPQTFLHDLALQMSRLFLVKADVVDGTGLYFRPDKHE